MKTQTWLGGLLAVQLVLAGGLFLSDMRAEAGLTPRPLLGFELADVDRVVIDDNSMTATLQREGENWVLPELAGLPGNETRIENLLDDLEALQTRYPVAETDSAHERFSLEEDQFERRVRFYQGQDLLGEFYLGSSPGFRLSHVRRAGEDEVYALSLNSFDFPGDDNDWLDKTLLAAEEPKRIAGANYVLAKAEETWAFDPPTDGLDLSKAENLASALAGLRVLRLADESPQGESIVLQVTDAAGEREYRFQQDDEAGRYYVQRGDREAWFTLSQFDYERIAELDRADLILPPPSPAEAGAGELSENASGAEEGDGSTVPPPLSRSPEPGEGSAGAGPEGSTLDG